MRRIFGAFSFLFAFIILCSLCGACCSTGVLNRPLSGPQLAKATDDMTVALVHTSPLRNDGVTYPFCTGVWVSDDVILTAGHCVIGLAEAIDEENAPPQSDEDQVQEFIKKLLGQKDDEKKDAGPTTPILGLNVQFIMPKEVVDPGINPAAVHNSTSFAVYKHNDLALLKVVKPESLPAHGIARVAEDDPDRGEQVSFTGQVKGLYWSYITGTVSAYRNDLSQFMKDDDTPSFNGPFMQVSAPIYYGNSGGGAFNDRGELVGIVSFLAPAPNTAFCIVGSTIRGVLQAHKIIPMVIDPTAPEPKEYQEQKK